METIYQIVKRAERNLQSGRPIKLGKYASHDHAEKIAMIDAYLNSQHISGPVDSLGREKPFFNIVKAAVNVWWKATDIDRKNIRFKATKKKNWFKSFVATLMLRDWMRKQEFGKFLNDWGYALSKYGSTVLKFVEKGDELIPTVVAWDRLICDPIDFENNVQIEKLWLTPAQLKEAGYNEEKVEEVLREVVSGNETRETIEGEQKDSRTEYIGVYELHGNLPLYYLTNKEEDKSVYRQQMHVVFIKKGKTKKEDKELTLYSGKEKQSPYFLTHLIREDGRTLSVGAVESLFDPQWMVNHSVKQIKDQLDYASKMILQTADPNFLGRNVSTSVESGQILIHQENMPLTQVNNQSHDLPNITNYLMQWKQLAREIGGYHEAITGQTMPSGTPYSLAVMLNREANSLFEMMLENKGLQLEEMLRKYILPFFKKQLNNSDEIALLLEGTELEKYDEAMLPINLKDELMARIMAGTGELPSISALERSIREREALMGGERFISPGKKTWKEYFEDLDTDAIEVEITGENEDKQAVFTTLTTLFQTIAANPAILQNPNGKMIFNKILEESGVISPLEIKSVSPQPVGMPAMPEVGALAQITPGIPG